VADISNNYQDTFFTWPEHLPPNGFSPDRRVDIAVVPRKLPLSMKAAIAQDSAPSPINLPDIYAILACVEHTVSPKTRGLNHNKDHAYAKLNELLKCPMNFSSIVLGIHGKEMVIWYGDRSGVIQAYIGDNHSYALTTIRGLANLAFSRDPCVTIYRVMPTRIYKVVCNNEIFYGFYGPNDDVIYVADGIAGKGTLVIPGLRGNNLLSVDPIRDFDEAAERTEWLSNFHTHPSHGVLTTCPWRFNLNGKFWNN
jgi:hypothetical protein